MIQASNWVDEKYIMHLVKLYNLPVKLYNLPVKLCNLPVLSLSHYDLMLNLRNIERTGSNAL